MNSSAEANLAVKFTSEQLLCTGKENSLYDCQIEKSECGSKKMTHVTCDTGADIHVGKLHELTRDCQSKLVAS